MKDTERKEEELKVNTNKGKLSYDLWIDKYFRYKNPFYINIYEEEEEGFSGEDLSLFTKSDLKYEYDKYINDLEGNVSFEQYKE